MRARYHTHRIPRTPHPPRTPSPIPHQLTPSPHKHTPHTLTPHTQPVNITPLYGSAFSPRSPAGVVTAVGIKGPVFEQAGLGRWVVVGLPRRAPSVDHSYCGFRFCESDAGEPL